MFSLGGAPVIPCEYDFGVSLNDVPSLVEEAARMENLAIGAENALLVTLTSTTLQQQIVTLALVDARHASYLTR